MTPQDKTTLSISLLRLSFSCWWKHTTTATARGTPAKAEKFACTNGFILTKELQMEGKKKLLTEDFLRGYRKTE